MVNDNWYTNEYGGDDEWNQVNIIVNDVDNIDDIESAVSAKLNTNPKTPVIRIRDATSQLATETAALSTVTTFIMAIGGISLLVAAVSIFNVMMMSVSERVQEIGILLSIGTETGEVRRMFLYKAFILGLLGAAVGGICSLAIGYTVVEAMIGTTAYFFDRPVYCMSRLQCLSASSSVLSPGCTRRGERPIWIPSMRSEVKSEVLRTLERGKMFGNPHGYILCSPLKRSYTIIEILKGNENYWN